MARPAIPEKRKQKIIDFCTRMKGTVPEAVEKFGLSRAYIYRLLKAHETDLESPEETVKVTAAFRNPAVTMAGKTRCDCWSCGKPYFLPMEDNTTCNIICSKKCADWLANGFKPKGIAAWLADSHKRGDSHIPDTAKRMIAKNDFAFAPVELKYMPVEDDDVNDLSDLIE